VSHDNVFALKNPALPNEVRDTLTEVLREGARTLLAQAIEAEVAEFLAGHADERDASGRMRLVRNGHLPERTVQTGIGAVAVKAPRVRDRTGELRFASAILPPYLRRTKTMEELLPWLYLKGISTGGFSDALAALLGRDAPGLSASTISRLKAVWQEEHAQWEKRSLAHKRYVYLWVDGIHFGVRMEEANQCILVVMGATVDGKKELVALTDGFRESAQSWKDVLLDMKRRGLNHDPQLAIGDGALGFWKALPQVFGSTREQRCWVHKTANVLNKLPKHLQPKAKSDLHQIWMAATRDDAHRAFATFVQTYEPKYPKSAECLAKETRTRCSPSTTSRPRTGFTCAPPIRLNRPSPPFVCARPSLAAAARARAFCRRCSSSRKARSCGGEHCVAPRCSARSSPEFSSKTESKCQRRIVRKSPPDQIPIHNS
jgi:putative transposase